METKKERKFKAIKVSTKVFDPMGNKYEGAVISFSISTQPTQEYQQKVQEFMQKHQIPQGQNMGIGQSVEELSGRGSYIINYRSYKTVEDIFTPPFRNFMICKTDNGIPVGKCLVKLNSDEKFGEEILNKKVVEFFAEIFGEKNVEFVEE
jgi:hypothetical protein